jgi:hypothetical protein
MKKLQRDEMRNLQGGDFAPPPMIIGSVLTGTRLNAGQCFCDHHVTWSNGAYADICDQPCSMFNCTDPMFGHVVN